MGARLKCCVVVSFAVIASSNAGGQSANNEPKDKPMTTVRAEDIPQTVQIIGRLGQPLGSLITIRGKWIRPGIQVKDRSLVFHVDVVNGKEPEAKIELHTLQVMAISFPRHEGGRKPKPGELWDWRFDWGGSEPSPTAVEGENWEMRGVETGLFKTYSDDAWREIGVVMQEPECMGGFATRFEYIAVRRVNLNP